ncbi:MAG: hypothetical protein ACR2PV_00955 [Gammaproteobacteria bacterium]
MSKTDDHTEFLEILEEAKKQYADYLEVSGIFHLPTFQEEPDAVYQEPSHDSPLTVGKIVLE